MFLNNANISSLGYLIVVECVAWMRQPLFVECKNKNNYSYKRADRVRQRVPVMTGSFTINSLRGGS